ncbi:CPBP family intramembrane glutamic endopeptidase [Sanguibacter antarcticus]|uniref:CAAX prenyl protease-like protein n=1 Tax=Sanguibacter antarcticus TaxID=372484 RepID=A0A2A9E7S7_9MICO|nr:CPBP family intramembrane glutamic endopeptidase [Sanguibacter antarcticus]PFG34914.1 CAAX prenyl protease-like protein [Sanguibacter antarcticus]
MPLDPTPAAADRALPDRPLPASGDVLDRSARRRIGVEIWIVLGLSLGRSGVYALTNIVARLTEGTPLGEQSTALNTSQSPRPYLDLTYQLLSIGFTLVPVALALYLLSARGRGTLARIGLDRASPVRDTGYGLALAAAVGIPGLALYAAGRALGITVDVQAATLDPYWWTIPVLVLAALKNGLLEEVIVVAYLTERLDDLRWSRVKIIVASSLLRGSYHLYQGFGPFVGNVVMGVLFTWFYTSRWGRRRVMPLVVAHTILDVVAFVGYAFLPEEWLRVLGVG